MGSLLGLPTKDGLTIDVGKYARGVYVNYPPSNHSGYARQRTNVDHGRTGRDRPCFYNPHCIATLHAYSQPSEEFHGRPSEEYRTTQSWSKETSHARQDPASQ